MSGKMFSFGSFTSSNTSSLVMLARRLCLPFITGALILASLLTHAALPMAGLLRGVVKDVTEFRNGGPADDLTIVAARAR